MAIPPINTPLNLETPFNEENSSSSPLFFALPIIAAIGFVGTLVYYAAKRVWTSGDEPSPLLPDRRPPSPPDYAAKRIETFVDEFSSLSPACDPLPTSDGNNSTSSTTSSESRRKKNTRRRNEGRRLKRRKELAVTISSNRFSSEEISPNERSPDQSNQTSSSEEIAPSEPTRVQRKKQPATSEFIFTESSSIEESPPPSPRVESLYMTHNFIGMNIPPGQFQDLYNRATQLVHPQKGFTPSEHPHITIADARELQRSLCLSNQWKIQKSFDYLVQNRELIPLELITIYHQSSPHEAIRELLIVRLEESVELQNFRMILSIERILAPNAPITHQNRGFHVTLGSRFIPSTEATMTELRALLQSGNVITSSIPWPRKQ